MKPVHGHILITLIVIALVSAPSHACVKGADAEDYDNSIAVTVHPDESITVTLKGSSGESLSPWEDVDFRELSMVLNVTAKEGDLTTIANELRVVLDPSEYSELANLDMDLEGHAGATTTNLTAVIDYPGYLGVDGSLGFVVVEPPYGFALDLDLEAKLYYSNFEREELSMMVAMVPLLETQLSSTIMNATEGNIALERLELLDYEEEPDHASLRVRLSLSGDLQKGLKSVLEGMGAEITPGEVPEELTSLSIESLDYHVTFSGRTLVLEADSGGTVAGDFDGKLNELKDDYLGRLLEGDDLEQQDRALVALMLPIDLIVDDLHVESTTTYEEESYTSTFTVEGLGLRPPSFSGLLDLLEELSMRESSEDVKLVLEGATSGNQYVVFTVPDATKAPIVEEEGRVVWDMTDVDGLGDVTYEVKTRGLDTTTIVVASAVGIAAIGAAAFFLMKRKV